MRAGSFQRPQAEQCFTGYVSRNRALGVFSCTPKSKAPTTSSSDWRCRYGKPQYRGWNLGYQYLSGRWRSQISPDDRAPHREDGIVNANWLLNPRQYDWMECPLPRVSAQRSVKQVVWAKNVRMVNICWMVRTPPLPPLSLIHI